QEQLHQEDNANLRRAEGSLIEPVRECHAGAIPPLPPVYISTWLPNSTTRLVGKRKNSIALSALRSIQAKSFSRQMCMAGRAEGSSVWRARKKLVSIILKFWPQPCTRASAAGTSASSMKP